MVDVDAEVLDTIDGDGEADRDDAAEMEGEMGDVGRQYSLYGFMRQWETFG